MTNDDSNTSKKVLMIEYLTLAIVIGTLISILLNFKEISADWKILLFIIYLIILIIVLMRAFNIFSKLSIYWRKRKETKYWTNCIPEILFTSFNKTIKGFESIISGSGGSLEMVIKKFFDKPITPSSASINFPTIHQVFPDFNNTMNLFFAQSTMMINSFGHISASEIRSGTRIRLALSDLCRLINNYIIWYSEVYDKLTSLKTNCPSTNLSNAKKEYEMLKSNYSQMIMNFHSLIEKFDTYSAYENTKGFECNLSMTELKDFP